MDNMETIIESLQGNIKIIRYNKPKRKNAIDSDMFVRVTRILHEAAEDQNVSMIVFTGTGDYFSSGNDLVAAQKVHGPTFMTVIHDLFEALITFPKLLVAVVNGPAVGVAATTLPLFDLIYATEDTFFYTPFGKLGITSEGCSTYTFPRIMGYKKALEMLLLNRKMNAKEALDCGFVNYLYKPEDIQSKVWDKLAEISNLSDDLVTSAKRLMRRPIQDRLIKVNDEEIAVLSKFWAARQAKQEDEIKKS